MIIDWIIENKFADNIFQATNIANGLKLAEIHDQPELQQKRVRLYRRWRNSQVYGKNSKPCYEQAIAGNEPPKELELKPAQEAAEEV